MEEGSLDHYLVEHRVQKLVEYLCLAYRLVSSQPPQSG
jgi:hypothetical protein